MLRFVCFCLTIALAGPVLAQPRLPGPSPTLQEPQVALAVWSVMQLDRMMPILQQEAVEEGREMASTMFPRGGTGLWPDRVARIHHPDRLRRLFLSGAATAAARVRLDDLQRGLAFYKTGLGRKVIALEARARAALLNPTVEEAAGLAWARARLEGDPRARKIARLLEEADLIEPNVAGGLNASIAFSKGFRDSGGFPMPLSDEEILADAWRQEPQLREDAVAWIGAYLFLAYASLGDRELDMYVTFSGSDGGRALASLLFAAFDSVFTRTSYDMGQAAAAELRGRQL